MSFLRHEEIYRSDVELGKAGSGNWCRRSRCSSASMSYQSAIPWQVALRQSLPPLRRLVTILNNPTCRTMIFQPTATTPLTSCLSPRVHSKTPAPCPTPPSPLLTTARGANKNRRKSHYPWTDNGGQVTMLTEITSSRQRAAARFAGQLLAIRMQIRSLCRKTPYI